MFHPRLGVLSVGEKLCQVRILPPLVTPWGKTLLRTYTALRLHKIHEKIGFPRGFPRTFEVHVMLLRMLIEHMTPFAYFELRAQNDVL